MSEETGRLIVILLSVGTAISVVTLFGGGYLVWKARNDMRAAQEKARQYKAEFEVFLSRLKAI